MTGLEDDPSIFGEETCLRRVDRNYPNMFKIDSATGIERPTSAAFKYQNDGLSVFREKILVANDLNYRDIILKPGQVVASLHVEQIRSCNGLGVCNDPWPKGIPDENHKRNAAHALVVGWNSLSKLEAKAHQRFLAKNCQILDD